jgi:hypothetical protein
VDWKAIARSATGTSHKKQQLPCQDYGQFIISNKVILGAVADGSGSAKHSDVGAKLTVKTALDELLRLRQCNVELHWPAKLLPDEQAGKFFTIILNKVVKALQERAASSDYSINDLSCTLLVFLATPNWVAAMQIGDGFIVVRLREGEDQLLFTPDKGEFINETTFVTSANAINEMRVRVLPGQQKFICASTDGLERVAIRMSDWTPFPPFFQPLEEYMVETSHPEQEDEYIKNFLDSERLNAKTDDDKTLLLCLYDDPKVK